MKVIDLIGKRVLLRNEHPSAGSTGVVEKAEMAGIPAKPALKVNLDNGRSCYVFTVSDLTTIK